jgi:hypothetical protein
MVEMSVVSLMLMGLEIIGSVVAVWLFKVWKIWCYISSRNAYCNRWRCVKWNKESGLKGYWNLGLSNSCGVGILLRDPDRFKHCTFRCDATGRIISLDCTFNSQDLRFINIYAPTDGTISHRNNRYRMRTPIFCQWKICLHKMADLIKRAEFCR